MHTNGNSRTNGHHAPPAPPQVNEQVAAEMANVEAERAAIGCALVDPDAIAGLVSTLTADDYHLVRHGWIHDAIVELHRLRSSVDMVTVSDYLERQGQLDKAGGMAYLVELYNAAPMAIYVDHYTAIVGRFSWLRRAMAFGQQVVGGAYGGMQPDELYQFVRKAYEQMAPSGKSANLLDWDGSFDYYWTVLSRREEEAKKGANPWRWPWPSWNRILSPADPGALVLISGDTSTGKTVVMECLAEWWAMQGKQVLFAHWELNWELMQDRRMVRHSGVPREALLSGTLTDAQRDKLFGAEATMRQWPGKVHLLQASGYNVDQLASEVRAYHAAGQCDVLIVDYADMIEASPRQGPLYGNNRFDRQADDIAVLKATAEQLQIRLVTATQLRKSGKEVSSVDQLSRDDIEGSGQKANKVNVIVLLHRQTMESGEINQQGDMVTAPGGLSRTISIKIAKNTMGETGMFRMAFVGERYAIAELEKGQPR